MVANYEKDPILEKRFNLLKAKLIGYTYPPREVKALYDVTSIEGRYALSVSSHYNEFSDKPIVLMEQLINEDTNNPFFYELLAEILFTRKDFNGAIDKQKLSLKYFQGESDLLYMLMGNYLKHDKKLRDEAYKVYQSLLLELIIAILIHGFCLLTYTLNMIYQKLIMLQLSGIFYLEITPCPINSL
jgi:predicted Zn-dependent protease